MPKLASPESRNKIIQNTEEFVQETEHYLLDIKKCHEHLQELRPEYTNGKKNLLMTFYENVLEFEIGRIFILAEIASSLRNFLATDYIILKRYHILQMRARIQEGMKYFKGFQGDKDGIWQRLKPFMKEYEGGKYFVQYNECTKRLGAYNELTGSINKKSRDIFEHFDSPTSMYCNWKNSGDEEFAAKMSIAFFDQIQTLEDFIHLIYDEVMVDLGIELSPNTIVNQTEYSAPVHQLLAKTFRRKLYPQLVQTLKKAPEELDSHYRVVSTLQSEFMRVISERIDYVAVRQMLTSLSEMVMFIGIVRTELACSLVTYIQSNSDFESTLNLRRLHMIKTAAIIKIYGYSEDQREHSLWHLATTTLSIIDKYKKRREQLEKKMQDMVSERGDDLELRTLYVHYRDKKTNNVLKLFDKLDSINPMKEIDASHQLLLLLNEIQAFCFDVLSVEKQEMQKRSEESEKRKQIGTKSIKLGTKF